MYGSSILVCLRWILCRVASFRVWMLRIYWVPLSGLEIEVEEGRVLVISSHCLVVHFLYHLVDDAPRPIEYVMCCAFGWFFVALTMLVCVVLFMGAGVVDVVLVEVVGYWCCRYCHGWWWLMEEVWSVGAFLYYSYVGETCRHLAM